MKLRPYPKYKDSGVEWLGKVPDGWSSVNLKWISTRFAGGTPDKDNIDFWTDGTIPWINSGAVNQINITEPSAFITEEAYRKSSAKWIPADSLVMALAGQGKTKGMVAQLSIPTTCNQSMAAIIPSSEIYSRFLFWWLNSLYQNIRNLSGGDLRDGLNLELLGGIPCPIFEFDEQVKLANFLDRETSKLDILIAKQEKLIELLQEKRQAIISHAVTKGLNPDAKMKDSAVEWLGMVPESWKVCAVKYLCDVRDGTHDTPEYVEKGALTYPLVTSKDLVSGKILFEEAKHISEADYSSISKRSGVSLNNLLMPMIGTVGGAVIVNTKEKFAIKNVALFKPYDDCNPLWLNYQLNSEFASLQFNLERSGGVQAFVALGTLRNLIFSVPSIKEQTEIVDYLDNETSKIDSLIEKANRSIELAKEHRTALISAAVTGKIDVREAA